MTEEYRRTPGQPAQSPSAARQRIEALQNNPDWRARYLAGEPAAARELEALKERAREDDLDRMIDRTFDEPGFVGASNARELSSQNMDKAVGWLVEDGMPGGVIRQVVRGEPIPKYEYDGHKQFQRSTFGDLFRPGDQEWRSRLLSGDPGAFRDLQDTLSATLHGAI